VGEFVCKGLSLVPGPVLVICIGWWLVADDDDDNRHGVAGIPINCSFGFFISVEHPSVALASPHTNMDTRAQARGQPNTPIKFQSSRQFQGKTVTPSTYLGGSLYTLYSIRRCPAGSFVVNNNNTIMLPLYRKRLAPIALPIYI
jgi:hypothetical protein